MKTTHTPGPWTFEPDPLNEIEGTFIIGDNGRELVARLEEISSLDGNGGTNDKLRNHAIQRERANARLIAAAPELLEALELVRHQSIEFGRLHDDTKLKIDWAIDKAKGL